MLNAYDNTIVAEDYMLDSIVAMALRHDIPAAMLYTSDHGEDLYDTDDERFMHASPIPTAMQIHVPMIAWLSPRYRELYPGMWDTIASHRDSLVSSSSSYFHTALQLAGIATPRFDATLSLASPTYAPRTPMYVTDHNTSVPLKELLLPAGQRDGAKRRERDAAGQPPPLAHREIRPVGAIFHHSAHQLMAQHHRSGMGAKTQFPQIGAAQAYAGHL